jgi:hypothetical protein
MSYGGRSHRKMNRLMDRSVPTKDAHMPPIVPLTNRLEVRLLVAASLPRELGEWGEWGQLPEACH